jgi:hypothetical protein
MNELAGCGRLCNTQTCSVHQRRCLCLFRGKDLHPVLLALLHARYAAHKSEFATFHALQGSGSFLLEDTLIITHSCVCVILAWTGG